MLLTNKIFWFLLLLVLAQWYVPGSMILEQEDILKTGKSFKFKTAPIDPADPFRGRYVALRFEQNEFEIGPEGTWEEEKDGYGEKPIFVLLDEDSEGFAKISNLSLTEPPLNVDFVKARTWTNLSYIHHDKIKVTINYPFDRFYMEEFKAPKAEKIYREAQIDSSQIAFALVKIKEGNAVIENVFVNGKPIADWVEEN